MRPLLAVATVSVAALLAVAASTEADPGCERSCKIAAAQAYLDALVSHDASAVPLAPNARRVENGFVTGRSGAGLRRGLERDQQYRIIRAIRDERFTVEGDDVMVWYLIDTALYPGGPQIVTSHVAERFRVVDGQLAEIEAIWTITPGKARTGWF